MNLQIWEDGKKDELWFWKGWLSGKGRIYESQRRLIDRFDFMIGDKKEVTIANLGAGAVSMIGDSRPDVKIKVIASDILADEYQKLCAELNLKPFNPIEKQDMTSLTYDDNSFDIVYCTNALDHSQDPYKALQEMVRVCKSEGFIYLDHFVHEGKWHNYHGLHQWNLDITEDEDCIIWNKNEFETDAFLLSDIYPGFTTKVRPYSKTMAITSFVQKK